MVGAHPRSTADMKELRKYLRMARRRVTKSANNLPDQDAYAMPYSMLADLAEDLDSFLVEIQAAMKEAESFTKKDPQQPRNRAKKWCTKP